MTKKTPSLTAASLPLPEANGYYSTEDEQRMQALARALLQGRRPIALSSASNDALEHYSRLLVRDLRQHDHVKVVAHLPGSCDQLVQQVNGLLADLPLSDVVTRDPDAQQPVHVFLVHDSPTLSSAEFALLVRLVNDLPGANLRIALIQDRDFAVTGNLQALGAQALHWRIQVAGMPASTSSQATREALREALREPPETLPLWAQPTATPPARRRWRLAFWRRDEPTSATKTPARNVKSPAASRTGHTQATVKPLARPAARAAAKPLASSAKQSTKQAASKAIAVQRKAATVVDTTARRNRVVLVSGVLLSAALASGLGTWLSIQPSITRDAQPVTKPTVATTTAAIALRARP
jgi:hypothetical protein